MANASYVDPKQITLTVTPDPIVKGFNQFTVQGYAEQTYLKVERLEDSATHKTSTDGSEIAFMRNRNINGAFTFTLLQTATSNNDFDLICDKFEELPGVLTFSVSMTDALGNDRANGTACIVQRRASIEEAKDVTTREWKIFCGELKLHAKGSNQAAIA